MYTRVRTRARTRVRTHDVEDALIKLGYVFKKTTARKSRRQCNSSLQEDTMTGHYPPTSDNNHCYPNTIAKWWSKLLLFSASLPRQWDSKCRWRQVPTDKRTEWLQMFDGELRLIERESELNVSCYVPLSHQQKCLRSTKLYARALPVCLPAEASTCPPRLWRRLRPWVLVTVKWRDLALLTDAQVSSERRQSLWAAASNTKSQISALSQSHGRWASTLYDITTSALW